LGIAVIEMLENVTPQSITIRNIQKDNKFSSDLRDFLSKCLNRFPERRPDVFELQMVPLV
jgi:serine/threonine protein kinase